MLLSGTMELLLGFDGPAARGYSAQIDADGAAGRPAIAPEEKLARTRGEVPSYPRRSSIVPAEEFSRTRDDISKANHMVCFLFYESPESASRLLVTRALKYIKIISLYNCIKIYEIIKIIYFHLFL